MPRLGVLELATVLQEGLVPNHDHMTLAAKIQVLAVILAAALGFDDALGEADMQAESALDVFVDRVFGDFFVKAWDQFVDEVVDIEDHPLTVDTADALDLGDQTALGGVQVFEQRAFKGQVAEFHDVGDEAAAEVTSA